MAGHTPRQPDTPRRRRSTPSGTLAVFGALLLAGCPAVGAPAPAGGNRPEPGDVAVNEPPSKQAGAAAMLPAPPAPRPLIGAIRWDAWHRPHTATEPGGPGGPVVAMMRSLGPQRYHGRLPFSATVVSASEVRIDGYTQEIIDREIGFAKAGGIDYWAFLLYVAYPGGRHVVRFGGAPGHFVVPALKAAGELTVFSVARRVPGLPSGKYGRILSSYDGATRRDGKPVDWVAPSWCVPVMDEQPFAAKISETSPKRVDSLWIGLNMSNQGDPFLGDLCEILVYSHVLNAAEMQAVRALLRAKWAPGCAWDGPSEGERTD